MHFSTFPSPINLSRNFYWLYDNRCGFKDANISRVSRPALWNIENIPSLNHCANHWVIVVNLHWSVGQWAQLLITGPTEASLSSKYSCMQIQMLPTPPLLKERPCDAWTQGSGGCWEESKYNGGAAPSSVSLSIIWQPSLRNRQAK